MDVQIQFHSPNRKRYGNNLNGIQNSNFQDTELLSYQYSMSTYKKPILRTNRKIETNACPNIQKTAEISLMSIQSCAQQNQPSIPLYNLQSTNLLPNDINEQKDDNFFEDFHQKFIVKFQTESSIQRQPIQRILVQASSEQKLCIEEQTHIQESQSIKDNQLIQFKMGLSLQTQNSKNQLEQLNGNKININLHINKIRGEIKKRIAFKSMGHIASKVKMQSSLIINQKNKNQQKQSLIKNPNIFCQFQKRVSPDIFRKNNSLNTNCLLQTFNPRINRSWRPSPPLSSRLSTKQNYKRNIFENMFQINNPQTNEKRQQSILKIKNKKKNSLGRKQLRELSNNFIDKNLKMFDKIKDNTESKNLFNIEALKIQKFNQNRISKKQKF